MKSRSDFLEHDEQEWENYLLYYYSGQILNAVLANPLYGQIMNNSIKQEDLTKVTSIIAIQQAQELIKQLKKTLQENYQTRLKNEN